MVVRWYLGGWHRTPACHDRDMPVARSELSSLNSALEELTRRVSEFGDIAHREKHDELAADLFAVERSLRGATRRLNRIGGAEQPR